MNDGFYEDWLVKEVAPTAVRVDACAGAFVIRGWDVSRVRADPRTSFYPCRAVATCTLCGMRVKCAGSVPISRRPFFEDGRNVATRSHYGRVDLRSRWRCKVRAACSGCRSRGLEASPNRDLAGLQVAPQRYGKTPRERHDADTAHTLASTREAPVEPSRQRAAGL